MTFEANDVFLVKDSWGVTSPRQQAAGFLSKNGVDYFGSLSNCGVKWHTNSKTCQQIQLHKDLITVMIINENDVILTASYSGEVFLWLWEDGFKMITHFQCPTNNVIFGLWSSNGDEFFICSKGPKQMLIVYSLANILSQCTHKVCIVDYKWYREAPQLSIENKRNETDTYDCYNMGMFKNNLELLAIFQSSKICKLILFSYNGEIIKEVVVSPIGDEKNIALCISEIYQENIVIGLQRGIFGIYNVETLNMNAVIQAPGSPQACLWYKGYLVTMSYMSGMMSFWSKTGELIKELQGGPKESIVQLIAAGDESYFCNGIMSIHLVSCESETKLTKRSEIMFLATAACGVDVSSKEIIATGDMTGNVFLWKDKSRIPIANLKTPSLSAVRCLCWIEHILLVGTLNGELCFWDNKTEYDSFASTDYKASKTFVCTQIYHFIDDVITIKLNSKHDQMAVGTTGGDVYAFSISVANSFEMNEVFHQKVHKPVNQGNGTELMMEIWGLVWSVSDEYIATGSEDKSTVISRSDTGEHVKTLTGHTSAVTAVDWKRLSVGNELLISCSDDKTVRIYDGTSFELIHVMSTSNIYGWHTLTYLCISPKRNLLFVTTQHGFIVVWDLMRDFQRRAEWKMHLGSIEGLCLTSDEDYLITISSDCVVNKNSLQNFN